MKKYHLEISVNHPIDNLTRKRHILLIPYYDDGTFLIGEKNYLYPPGIYRLAGGGVDEGESPSEAGIREAKEELSVDLSEKSLEIIAEILLSAESSTQTYQLTTYIAKFKVAQEVFASDDLSAVKRINLEELKELIERYKNLKGDDWYQDPSGYKHSWGDYGKVYAPIHQIVYELLKGEI